jgi:hypothetical protein
MYHPQRHPYRYGSLPIASSCGTTRRPGSFIYKVRGIDGLIRTPLGELVTDLDYRDGWVPTEANFNQGMKVLDTLYRGEQNRIYTTFGAHKDVRKSVNVPKFQYGGRVGN